MMDSRFTSIHNLGHYLAYIWQYRGMLRQMVGKDFKGRFKNTIFGYFWHLLNPLSQIVIYLLIFTVIFGRDVPNYWVYVSTGMFAFSFFMTSTAGSSNCIVNNSNVVTKMAMAREIIPISKVLMNLITLSISYCLLLLLMAIFGVEITVNILWVPVIVALLLVFSLGMVLLLCSVTVYVRDIANIVGILFGCLMFAIPIMYLAETRSTPMMEVFWSINPLYYYIEIIHDVFFWGNPPDMYMVCVCILSSIVMFAVGLYVFKKLERGFAERL